MLDGAALTPGIPSPPSPAAETAWRDPLVHQDLEGGSRDTG